MRVKLGKTEKRAEDKGMTVRKREERGQEEG